MHSLAPITWALLTSCGDGDPTDTSPEDGVPFETVVIGNNSSTKYCGPVQPTGPVCNEEGLTVLVADDAETFASLFGEHIKLEPPAVDMNARVALLSYLPICPTLDVDLYVTGANLDASMLHLAELLAVPDGFGEVIGCPYNVITISADLPFTQIAATMAGGWD